MNARKLGPAPLLGACLLALFAASACAPAKPTLDLRAAAEQGSIQQVKAHLYYDKTPRGILNAPLDKTGIGLIHVAAQNGRSGLVDFLLKRGAYVNDRGDYGFDTLPIHMAVANGQADTVALLLSRRSAVDVKDRHGATPLALARKAGRRDIVKLLMNYGAKE